MRMRFKSFEIRGDGDKFELVKWQGDGCFVVGWLEWNCKDECFSFRSCGLRYLQYKENGLADWLLAWCKMKEIEYHFAAGGEEEEEEKDAEKQDKNEDRKDDVNAGEKAGGAASPKYLNTPPHLSDEEWGLICDSFTRTIEEAKIGGPLTFECPVYLPCNKCPLLGNCKRVAYSAEVWEDLEKKWKAQYEYNEEEKAFE